MHDDELAGLERIARRVEAALEAYLDAAADQVPVPDEGAGAGGLLEAVRALTLRGGKRLRPALAYFAALSVAPEARTPGLVPACAALELLQSYLLIHDDIMDGDDTRRGGPTVHRMLADGDAVRGRNRAILAGDLAAVAARQMLEASGAARRGAAAIELAWMEWEVIHGQLLDLDGSPDVATMHDLKTGSYTTRGPVRFGAALAGGDERERAALEAFARPLGLAFQLRDDLLDVTGDPGRTGKPVGTDLRAGRVSAVIQRARERAGGADRAVIEDAWGVTELPDDALSAALAAIVRSGAVDDCVARVRALSDDAVAALASVPLREEGAAELARLARALARRAT